MHFQGVSSDGALNRSLRSTVCSGCATAQALLQGCDHSTPKVASEGLTVEGYIERIARDDQQAEEELEMLALEGLN